MTKNEFLYKNEKNNNLIKELKDEISNLKTQNNLINLKFNQSTNNNEKLSIEIATLKKELNNKLNELNIKFEISERDRKKFKKENELIKCRDTIKVIIDFVYAQISKSLDLNIKYEKKVELIINNNFEIKHEKEKKFFLIFSDFLKKIYKDKLNGDSLAHTGNFQYSIFEGYKEISNFFIDFLEIHKTFKEIKNLYMAKDEKEKEKNIKLINNSFKNQNFIISLRDFVYKNN